MSTSGPSAGHASPTTAYTCTETSLVVLRPVGVMFLPDQALVRRWLTAHLIDPDTLAVGRPVSRDPDRREVRWSQVVDDVLVDRVRREPKGAPDVWPLPFPVELVRPSEFVDEDGYTLSPR